MTIESFEAVAVIEQHFAAVAVCHGCVLDASVGCGVDGLAQRRGDIDAGVEGAVNVEGILALPERTGDTAHHRPHRRSLSGGRPVGLAGADAESAAAQAALAGAV